MHKISGAMIWIVVTLAMIVPLLFAANSPLLQWRDPVYIVAGFAGVVAMLMLLLQPLLASGYLPGLEQNRHRQLHRIVGSLLVLAIIVHVAGLWITSPPDVIDALLFRSATPFSVWGVTAMWGVILTATLAACLNSFRTRLRVWRIAHKVLAAIIVAASVIHAVLIDGTMESISKYALCTLLVVVTFLAVTKSMKLTLGKKPP